MTSTLRRTSSAARSASGSTLPSANLDSRAMFWPSLYPRSASPRRNASMLYEAAAGETGINMPTRGTFPAGCASTATGVTTMLMSPASKDRRCMTPPASGRVGHRDVRASGGERQATGNRRLASPLESDSQLPGPTAHRCRLPGELQALPGVRHARAVDAKNRNIAVEEVTHIEIFAIGAEHEALGKAADLKFVDLCHTLAVDAQDDDSTVAVVIPGALRCIRAP